MSNHTPGPWAISSDIPTDVLSGEILVADCEMFGSAECNAELVANARLIAAAPDLLEALKWCIDEMASDSGTGTTYWEEFVEFRHAVATIAKAEGRDA